MRQLPKRAPPEFLSFQVYPVSFFTEERNGVQNLSCTSKKMNIALFPTKERNGVQNALPIPSGIVVLSVTRQKMNIVPFSTSQKIGLTPPPSPQKNHIVLLRKTPKPRVFTRGFFFFQNFSTTKYCGFPPFLSTIEQNRHFVNSSKMFDYIEHCAENLKGFCEKTYIFPW